MTCHASGKHGTFSLSVVHLGLSLASVDLQGQTAT